MSDFSDSVTVAEGIAIALLIYAAYKALNAAKTAATAALTQAGAFADVTGVQPWVATVTPLTPGHADSLARFIGVAEHGGGWKLSPDGTQIWFFDGSFFDNKSGHLFDKNGNDQGDLLGNPAGQVTSSADVTGIDTTTMDAANMSLMGA